MFLKQICYCLYCSPLRFIKVSLPSKALTAYEVASLVFCGTPSLTRIGSFSLTSANRVALLITTKAACLMQKNFHGRELSIRVFFSDGHHGLIVFLRG